MCLSGRTAAMASAMAAVEDDLEKRSRYAASTYALSKALFATAKKMDRKRKSALRKVEKKRLEAETASLVSGPRKVLFDGPGGSTAADGEPDSFAPLPPSRSASGKREYPMRPTLVQATAQENTGSPSSFVTAPVSNGPSRRGSVEDSGAIPEEELPESIRLPEMLYWHRSGKFSLESVDPKWAEIECADEFGFCGLTSMAMVKGTCEADNFQVDADGVCHGYSMRVQFADKKVTYETHECDVIGFESARTDDTGMHAAVLCESSQRGAFPPNSTCTAPPWPWPSSSGAPSLQMREMTARCTCLAALFRLKKILKPGEWKAPGGVYPERRLLIVTATYHEPTLFSKSTEGKLFGQTITLEYANHDAYIKGLGKAFSKPICSMQDEFNRDLTWTDWQGEKHSLKECWEYVNGVAKAKQMKCSPALLNPGLIELLLAPQAMAPCHVHPTLVGTRDGATSTMMASSSPILLTASTTLSRRAARR